jgi:hypothetical protein
MSNKDSPVDDWLSYFRAAIGEASVIAFWQVLCLLKWLSFSQSRVINTEQIYEDFIQLCSTSILPLLVSPKHYKLVCL